jgi:hypothetical protein
LRSIYVQVLLFDRWTEKCGAEEMNVQEADRKMLDAVAAGHIRSSARLITRIERDEPGMVPSSRRFTAWAVAAASSASPDRPVPARAR